MLYKLCFALIPIAVILVSSELLWRKKLLKDEWARKFIHVLAGLWIAFWPFYIPFDGIFVLSTAMLALVLYSRVTRLFHAIYAVNRKTYGDIFYAISILVCAYLGQQAWIFLLSILLMVLADGAAAMVGKYAGSMNTYRVFSSKYLKKSVAGTVAFFLIAQISVLVAWFFGGEQVIREHVAIIFLLLPFGATILENILPFGLDNLFTPILATVLLNSLL